jgi:hypothetical protein
MVRILVLSALFAFAPLARAADDEAAKAEDIRHLMVVTGSAAMTEQVLDQVLAQMKPLAPGVPEEFWTRWRTQADPDALIEQLVPIYAKHFSHDEIKQLIAFYESPIGVKLVQEQPAIVQESMVVGNQWGRQLAERVIADVQAEQMKAMQDAAPPAEPETGKKKKK